MGGGWCALPALYGSYARECEIDIRNYKLYSKHKDSNNCVLQSLYVDCENTILCKLREQYTTVKPAVMFNSLKYVWFCGVLLS